MPFIFRYNGKVIAGDSGSPNPERYIKQHKFHKDTEWEEVDRNTYLDLRKPLYTIPVGRLPDSPLTQIKHIRDEYNTLLDVLETHLKLERGVLRKAIDDKLKEG